MLLNIYSIIIDEYNKYAQIRTSCGRKWKQVEASGSKLKRVETSGNEWKRVETSGKLVENQWKTNVKLWKTGKMREN